MLFIGLVFTPRQNGNQDSRGQHHGCFPASHWSLTPSYDSHEEGHGGNSLLERDSTAAATAPAPPLQMKTVANLDVDFARVQVVSSAESKTVVEQDAAIGNVDGLQVGGEFVAELLAERKVKGGVRLQVAWWRTAIGESGRVIDVRRGVGAPGERVLAAKVQRIALVVVEGEISRRRNGQSPIKPPTTQPRPSAN